MICSSANLTNNLVQLEQQSHDEEITLEAYEKVPEKEREEQLWQENSQENYEEFREMLKENQNDANANDSMTSNSRLQCDEDKDDVEILEQRRARESYYCTNSITSPESVTQSDKNNCNNSSMNSNKICNQASDNDVDTYSVKDAVGGYANRCNESNISNNISSKEHEKMTSDVDHINTIEICERLLQIKSRLQRTLHAL